MSWTRNAQLPVYTDLYGVRETILDFLDLPFLPYKQ